MGVQQLLRMRYWKEQETDKGNQGAVQIESSGNPELDDIDFA